MASAETERPDYDLIVIGSGWAGLVMCKYALEMGLKVRVFETRDNLGGVWYYTDDVNHVTVMKSTTMSSSSAVTEMSDFPMKKELGDFLTHQEVNEYLHLYATEFNLLEHITFSTRVEETLKVDHHWLISTSNNMKYTSRNIAVCTGSNQIPNVDIIQNKLHGYNGEISHTSQIKDFNMKDDGKTILVIGGGETASDVVDLYHQKAKQIIWSIPNGQQFFRKYSKLFPHRPPQALDKASSILLSSIAPHPKGKPGLAWICKWTTNGSLLAYQGHGIPEFRNEIPYLHQFVNKHAHVLNQIDYQHTIPKGKIAHAKDKTIYFEDGSSYEIDHIILCTGYKMNFPFLPSNYKKTSINDCFKYCLNADDPSLAYVGFARPVIGSIPMLIEFQSQFLCHLWSGRLQRFNFDEIKEIAIKDKKKWKAYFQDTSKRMTTLVDAFDYSFDLMRLAGTAPNYINLFLDNPRDCFTVLTAPGATTYCRINDKNSRQKALKTMRYHSKNTITPLNLLFILFLRIIFFDRILDYLGYVKYRVQINPFCKRLSNNRIIQSVNRVWTAPKRFIFDSQSHTLIRRNNNNNKSKSL